MSSTRGGGAPPLDVPLDAWLALKPVERPKELRQNRVEGYRGKGRGEAGLQRGGGLGAILSFRTVRSTNAFMSGRAVLSIRAVLIIGAVMSLRAVLSSHAVLSTLVAVP
jgi:hypothetical protein